MVFVASESTGFLVYPTTVFNPTVAYSGWKSRAFDSYGHNFIPLKLHSGKSSKGE